MRVRNATTVLGLGAFVLVCLVPEPAQAQLLRRGNSAPSLLPGRPSLRPTLAARVLRRPVVLAGFDLRARRVVRAWHVLPARRLLRGGHRTAPGACRRRWHVLRARRLLRHPDVPAAAVRLPAVHRAVPARAAHLAVRADLDAPAGHAGGRTGVGARSARDNLPAARDDHPAARDGHHRQRPGRLLPAEDPHHPGGGDRHLGEPRPARPHGHVRRRPGLRRHRARRVVQRDVPARRDVPATTATTTRT